MDTYIVWIYRRDKKEQDKFVGLVEYVGLEEKRSFRTMEELISLLKLQWKGLKKKTSSEEEERGNVGSKKT